MNKPVQEAVTSDLQRILNVKDSRWDLDDRHQMLVSKIEHLHGSGRHQWVMTDLRHITSVDNLPAYLMEVHFTHILESNGLYVNHSFKTGEGNSDVDIQFEANHITILIECVSLQEPVTYWNDGLKEIAYDSHGTAFHNEEESFLRRVQSKILQKTIRGENPIKFPITTERSVHIILADVTNGFGFHPDHGDIKLIFDGNRELPEWQQRDICGVFEATHGESSRYVRERIHAVIVIRDNSSGIQSGSFPTVGQHVTSFSLAPDFEGLLRRNPNLPFTPSQDEALKCMWPGHDNILGLTWWQK